MTRLACDEQTPSHPMRPRTVPYIGRQDRCSIIRCTTYAQDYLLYPALGPKRKE